MALLDIIYVNKVNLAMDIGEEIRFKTARSSGKGGQNVNKVETMVVGFWHIASSSLLSEKQKALVIEKLANRITAKGYIMVKSQAGRSQLGNKQLVMRKMNALIIKSLLVPKKRKDTKPGKAAKERRIEIKKRTGEIKQNRMKIKPGL